MSFYTNAEFRAQMDEYLEQGMTYVQAFNQVRENERLDEQAYRQSDIEIHQDDLANFY